MQIILLVFAFVCEVLAVFGVGSRFNLVAAGLAFWLAGIISTHGFIAEFQQDGSTLAVIVRAKPWILSCEKADAILTEQINSALE